MEAIEEYPPYRVICPETGKESWSLYNQKTKKEASFWGVWRSLVYNSLRDRMGDEFAEDYDFLETLFGERSYYYQSPSDERVLRDHLNKVEGWAENRTGSSREVLRVLSNYQSWFRYFCWAYSRLQAADWSRRYKKNKWDNFVWEFRGRRWYSYDPQPSDYEKFVEAKKERDKKRFSQGSADGKKEKVA